ncbi:MAG: YabP/YqfC family sporulation protein [Clostridia bacterium]|nr:YabP/YqfC family sporulation protein [Clostridia bacterium]
MENIGNGQDLRLKNRENLSVSGVLEVLSFSDKELDLDTNQGEVLIKGENLKIITMSSETGDLEAVGTVGLIEYRRKREKRGFFESVLR